jgi:C_GCAxxG_C_C family probable redox protein
MSDSINSSAINQDNGISRQQAKYWWLNCIGCSEASMTTQMRGFGFEEPSYEQAIHVFSGGFMHLGHACGLLTGAALAAGFRARSQLEDEESITEATLNATIQITEAFPELTGSINCREITDISFSTFGGKLKYLQQGKGKMCGRLHLKWASQAHDLIEKTLAEFDKHKSTGRCENCAVITMKRLVNSGIVKNEDSVLVAGLAGGIGLSGNVCGALAAGVFAVAANSYLSKKNKKRDSQLKGAVHEFFGTKNRGLPAQIRLAFIDKFGSELCVEISKKRFENISDHSSFIQNGGCSEVIEQISSWVIQKSST